MGPSNRILYGRVQIVRSAQPKSNPHGSSADSIDENDWIRKKLDLLL
jgi:hypothetical protein